jgi:hypothetical protein
MLSPGPNALAMMAVALVTYQRIQERGQIETVRFGRISSLYLSKSWLLGPAFSDISPL